MGFTKIIATLGATGAPTAPNSGPLAEKRGRSRWFSYPTTPSFPFANKSWFVHR